MKRQIVYQGQIPLETDVLLTNKNVLLALGSMMQAVFGSSVSVDGLACTPNSPAAMNVLVAPGVIHSLQNIDNSAYGTIAADTTKQVVKQGLIDTTTTLNCPAPVTTGQSVVYLVQVAFQETDEGGTVLPYYNPSDPSVPWSGPNGTGVSQNTVRTDKCLVSVKAGTPATTGSQATPAPDAGYTGLYAITVANGATSITSPNIQRLNTAPFIDAKLPDLLKTIQQDTPNFAQDTSGAANTITISLSPAPTLTDGMPIRVKVANSSTGATVMSINGGSNIACKTTSGAAFGANTVVANGIYTFVYDANGNRLQLQGFTAASATGLIPANNLSDVLDPNASLNHILPSQTGKAGEVLITNGTDASWQGPNATDATSGNPTGTSDTTGKMMGLGLTLTPHATGMVMVSLDFDMTNTNSICGGSAQIRYGTGAAPANGDALTGTPKGGKVKLTEPEVTPDYYPFGLNALITGLTPGTAYWFDIGLAAISGGTASIADISGTIAELR